MTELEQRLRTIVNERETKIIPENIKAGVTIFGIEGTLKEGMDTSDATAKATDIANGKIAYVNGEKITGTLWDTTQIGGATNAIEYNSSGTEIGFYTNIPMDMILRKNARIYSSTQINKLAEFLELTPEKIAAGVTILGVTGTYTGEDQIIDPVEPDPVVPDDDW